VNHIEAKRWVKDSLVTHQVHDFKKSGRENAIRRLQELDGVGGVGDYCDDGDGEDGESGRNHELNE